MLFFQGVMFSFSGSFKISFELVDQGELSNFNWDDVIPNAKTGVVKTSFSSL